MPWIFLSVICIILRIKRRKILGHTWRSWLPWSPRCDEIRALNFFTQLYKYCFQFGKLWTLTRRMFQLTNIAQDDVFHFTLPQGMFLLAIWIEHSQRCISFSLCLLDLCCHYLGRESTEDVGFKNFK